MTDQYKYCGLGRGRARVENFGFGNVVHSTENESMDVGDEEPNNHIECICRRPKKILFCKTCAYKGTGRLKIPCSIHPRNEMLMDMICCPICRTHSSNMLEFDGDLEVAKPSQSNNFGLESAEYPSSKVAENSVHRYISDDMHEFNKSLEEPKPERLSGSNMVTSDSNIPIRGIGRGSGISPLKRMEGNSSFHIITPGMSPLRKDPQSSNVFSRLSFPSGNEVRRPGTYRDH